MLGEILREWRTDASERSGASSSLWKDSRERAVKYVEDPEGYLRDILGFEIITDAQKRLMEYIYNAVYGIGKQRTIAAGSHGTGKSFFADGMSLWVFDPLGSRKRFDGQYQGGTILLPAPTFGTVRRSDYVNLLEFAESAKNRGHLIPGYEKRKGYTGASQRMVNWYEGPWKVESLTPRISKDKDIAHQIGGIHRANTIILMEEASGLDVTVIGAVDGLAVDRTVAVVALTNPTSTKSYLFTEVDGNPHKWNSVEFSSLDFPNIIYRDRIIENSTTHYALEDAIRSPSVQFIGYLDEGHQPKSDKGDFVYALPDIDQEDMEGPRDDGIVGHPFARPAVFRGNARFCGQFLGWWLAEAEGSLLFDINRIKELSRTFIPQNRPPDRVGVDCVDVGANEFRACPSWGPPARQLVDGFIRSMKSVDKEKQASTKPQTITYCGSPVMIPIERGVDITETANKVAKDLARRFGLECEYIFDTAFGGRYKVALDALARQTGIERRISRLVQFGGSPLWKPTEEGPLLNRRAEMALHAAMACNWGLAVVEQSHELIEEMRATGNLIVPDDSKHSNKKKLQEKKNISAMLGRSPDRLDSLILSLDSKPGPRPIDYSKTI